MIDLAEICKIFEFISAFLLVLFSVVILSQKKGRAVPRILLASFFICRAIILVSYALWNYEALLIRVPDIIPLGEPFLFLYAPLLYLYTRSLTSDRFRFNWYDMLHFLPFLIILGSFIFRFHIQSPAVKSEMVTNGAIFRPLIHDILWLWIQFLAYAAGCIFLLVRFRKKIISYNSSYDHDKLRWLNFLIIAFLVWKGIFLSGYLAGIFEGDYALLFKLFVEVGFLFYASMIIIKGLQMPDVVLSILPGKMYQTSPLKEENKSNWMEKLRLVMNTEKPYLEPTITLNELASQCDIPAHHLSQILNEELHMNFYNYINFHRIGDAKKLLSDPENKEMTILEVLYAVGFNSKSVFNTAFKKFVKMSPTEFRRKQMGIFAA